MTRRKTVTPRLSGRTKQCSAERKKGTVRALGPWILAGSVLGKTA